MITDSQSIVIKTDGDKEFHIPPMTLSFKISTEQGVKFMDTCDVTIDSRSSEGLKEYPMDDIGAKVFYNKAKKVYSIHFSSSEKTDNEPPSNSGELVELLDSLKDAEAIQAYRVAAWYWIIFDSGFGVANGTYVLVKADDIDMDESDISDSSIDYFNQKNDHHSDDEIDEEDEE